MKNNKIPIKIKKEDYDRIKKLSLLLDKHNYEIVNDAVELLISKHYPKGKAEIKF